MKKWMKVLSVTLAAALIAASFAACSGKKDDGQTTAAGDANKETLVMGTNAAFPPFEYLEGGQVSGFDADLMRAVAEDLGMKLEIKNMEFDSLPKALSSDQIDCIAAGMTVDAERLESMDFTDGYYIAKQTIIVMKDSKIASSADLKDKTIGGQTGTTGLVTVADKLTAKNKIKGFNSGALAVEALKTGKVDAVIIDNNPAKEYAKKNADLKLIENQFDDETYAVAVKKGNTELQKKINDSINKLKSNGKFQELQNKYFQ